MRVSFLCLALLVACSGQQRAAATKAPAAAPMATDVAAVPPAPPLLRAMRAMQSSDYVAAEQQFELATKREPTRARALLGLARLQLITGRYDEASRPVPQIDGESAGEHVLVRAAALRALGRLDDAVVLLQGGPRSPAARLLLGEVLLEMGQREAGNAALMTLVEDYNEDVIGSNDGPELAMVGRAAHFLRSPEDANDAFNQAEMAGAKDYRTLLWRAELFLDKYDVGHAEEVVSEVLERAPNHPDALVYMAQVHLDQALDFETATGLLRAALDVNPKHVRAYELLAGIDLRDMHLEGAEEHVNRGLAINPRDLRLLSTLGAVRFLADDDAGFDEVKKRVLTFNPHYSKFFEVIGRYADWEHRYGEIVKMMREAIAIDGDDANAHAQLGINLIRSGDDRGGVEALRTAFSKDPYNVRVYNTLNLYEETIPQSYVDVEAGTFKLRYPKAEREVLERYVPGLLNEAWTKMRQYYDFTPSTPVGVELYAERPNFAIRTSGLPRTAIQGVCFGQTLASMSPRHEEFNLGMTLWHELAHVFHIQLSHNRVPRWFTEGLAEYETLVERKEWARERDQELYLALREDRLPKLSAMNEAFTHAEDIGDVAVAYYASSQIVEMLASNYGRQKLRAMLVAWGEGKRTEQVLQEVLGKTPNDLDAEFRAFVDKRLSRFKTQFVPMRRVGDPRAVQQRAEAAPEDAEAQVKLALLALRMGELELAYRAVGRALRAKPGHPHALWIKARVALERNEHELAGALAQKLLDGGYDGYEVQIIRARSALGRGDQAEVGLALRKAHEFDPSKAEPLYGLLDRSAKDPVQRLAWLQRLSEVDEHSGRIYRELTERLLDAKRIGEAVEVAKSGVYAAMEDPSVHVAYAQALARAGRQRQARFEFESALDCPVEAPELAAAHLAYARYLQAQGEPVEASKQLTRAQSLDPKLSGEQLP